MAFNCLKESVELPLWLIGLLPILAIGIDIINLQYKTGVKGPEVVVILFPFVALFLYLRQGMVKCRESDN